MKQWSHRVVILMVLVLIGCSGEKVVSPETLMETDRAFARMAAEEGRVPAFLAFMDEEAVIYPHQGEPVRGMISFKTLNEGSERGDFVFLWEPTFAMIAKSGDLGYTLGEYKLVGNEPGNGEILQRGFYCTIWKKQADGSWKFVFDGGNENPLD
ncbi:MAG: DUF4440 domain-containing protein [Candidatus Aminicenantes bacterium]|nr:DUF4440 domain-containing protein [Candidatus Aminicenantes bacterium]